MILSRGTNSPVSQVRQTQITNWIHDLESNEKRLHVTKNFGETYSVVQDYVRNFFFQYNSGQTQLYIERIQPTTRYVFK